MDKKTKKFEKFYTDVLDVVKEAYEELKQENDQLQNKVDELKRDKEFYKSVIISYLEHK